MDLRANKKQQFDAFSGNALVKPSMRQNGPSKTNSNNKNFDIYNFDELWRGSVSNLMSSENITEDLIAESIKELENAMQESKRMLHERDTEIQRLRENIDKLKQEREKGENEMYPNILNDYKASQTRVAELECQIREINMKHSTEIEQIKTTQQHEQQQQQNSFPGCTCKCGLSCQAISDLNETKKNLETAKMKYDTLKRKVREFRKQMEMEQQEEEERINSEGKNITGCTLQ